MVSRGRLRRLKEAATRQGAVAIETTDGTLHVFSEQAVLGLFVLRMNETFAEHEGVPLEEYLQGRLEHLEDPLSHFEHSLRLRTVLERATPSSKAAFEEQTREFHNMVHVLKRSSELAGAS